ASSFLGMILLAGLDGLAAAISSIGAGAGFGDSFTLVFMFFSFFEAFLDSALLNFSGFLSALSFFESDFAAILTFSSFSSFLVKRARLLSSAAIRWSEGGLIEST